uniref:NADH dehydrogenase subunit 4 n=1 Tax=Morishitium polonicum TaxID=1962582 RepID=UPI0023AA320D|nr:NADH dehydrogenase subunit 4 [Morishitium polonicum]WCD42520.1 NADH dehydrogenase subunit 4 [Morishitium polonicum]
MGFKRFDWFSWCLGLGFGSIWLLFYCGISSLDCSWLLVNYCQEYGGIFVFDVISFYLCFLSSVLLFSLAFVYNSMSLNSIFFVSLSVVSSFFCYCCINGIWFWVFYEISILSLLILLILESPYSERFLASWYLLGYVVFTSLPMLLLIVYLSSNFGSFNLQVWNVLDWGSYSDCCFLVLLLILFVTKIPLFPFHTWLPVVHAEANSPVSVCLSGYVMKLGLLGVVRFGSFILPSTVFDNWYVVLCLGVSVLFFFGSVFELDGKRWLAFLSLSHIVVAAVCLSVCDSSDIFIVYFFCLGHGLSAGVMFLVLWLMSEVTGSRNWIILKNSMSGGIFINCVVISCLSTVASIPPTVQFFSEILVLYNGFLVSIWFVVLFFVYIFLGGLIPMIVVGNMLFRTRSVSCGVSSFLESYIIGSIFLLFWSFTLFFVF